MAKILGLDLGTNSIGWALIDDVQNKILGVGSRIFPMGVENLGDGDNEISKNASRTGARGVRRQFFRRRLRKKILLKALSENKMCPMVASDFEDWKSTKQFPSEKLASWFALNPYELRNKVLNEKLTLEIKKHSLLSKSRYEHKQTIYSQNDENYAMAIYELDGKREFELINNFNLAKLIKQGEGFYPIHKEKEIKEKKVLYPIAKSNNRDVVLKKGQQVIFYDKTVEIPKDISEIVDFKDRKYIIEVLTIQRQKDKKTGKINEYGIIQLRYFKEARKSEEISKDNFKPDGIFKLGENKPTRKMNHSQFAAFVEGIDFKVLPSGKFEKI